MAPGYRNSAEATGQYSIGSSASRFIYTVAGNYAPGYTGDGGPATLAEVNGMQGVAVDGAGNVYMADSGDNVVRKVDASTGIITTIAGTGAAGHSGDNGPATSAELWAPTALAVDAAGDLFVAETGDNVVRRIDAISGQITTFAGDPAGTFTTEGPATGYLFEQIVGLACDPLGNLYIEQHFNVLEVDASSGNIAEVAGNDTQYRFSQLDGIAVDSHGNVYVADEYAGWIWLLRANAVPIVFAGGSEAPGGGDGGPATEASLSFPSGLAVDGVGNLYIADLFDCTIREVNTNGMINTVAGIFDNWGFTGADGLPAANGILNWVQTLASDAAGNLYIADTKTNRIRKVTAPAAPPRTPVATPVFSLAASAYSSPQTLTITDATPGAEIYVTLDGSAPNTADQGYHGPIEITGAVTVQAVALAPGYVVSAPVSAAYTITAPPPAVISTVAGDGTEGFSGSGGLATNTEIGEPKAIAFDSAGNLYIADTAYSVVWKVAASTGIISIVAGTGTSENSGCYNGVATSTVLNEPDGIAFDKAGNLYISDAGDYCVRMVSAETGQISTVAGPGISTTIGDGSPATEAYLGVPGGLAFDAAGNLYIADGSINRVRMIAASTGNISTVAGYGEAGARGDGGLATLAELSDPLDVTVDGLGNLYIMDSGDNRIRKVTKSTGVIDTIAGNGVMGNTGDGGAAVAANINAQQGIALDSAGNVYFSNSLDTVREVSATTGMIRSVAGDGYFGYSGDGGAATMAELWVPQGLAFDAAGSLYIADSYNASVRKVGTPQLQSQNIAFTPPSPLYFGIPPITLSATGGTSGNPVTFSIVSGPGSLSGTNDSVLDVTGTGAIVVAANQAGDAGYAAAPQVIASIAVVSPAAATITSPASGTVLAGSSVTFAWSGAAEPTGYYLLIGSTGVGSNNIYNSAEKTVTTYTFPYMPTDGAKIYVRLFTNFNGNWLHNDYTYTAALRGTPMTSPAPGTSLGGSGVTFNWSAASGATGYFLWIGTTGVGSSNLYYSAEKTVTTYNFDHLPTNGGTIYVRLTTNYNGTWVYNDYTYTVSPPAVLTAPVSGSTLNGPNVTFDWETAPDATGYYLWIGSTGVGSNNIYNSAEKTVTSYTFTRVPTNGETIYVRLITNYSGTWLHNDYTYTASTQAAMTSPAPASTFIGSSVTFTWSAASGATGYYLQIGSTGVGSDDIYNSAEKTVTAYTFSRMPTNGETIYVRLTTNYNGTWLHEDYVYTAQ